jgi:hypothetical protein
MSRSRIRRRTATRYGAIAFAIAHVTEERAALDDALGRAGDAAGGAERLTWSFGIDAAARAGLVGNVSEVDFGLDVCHGGVFCPTRRICSAAHIRGVGQKTP